MRSLIAAVILPLGCSVASGQPPTARADEPPVVIELFTSQGCSSCPPADRLLSQLATAGEAAGRRIAPLSFHVDYWNGLGWADPYSSAAWTARQEGYAEALGDNRSYTPELVVAGGVGVLGSNTAAISRAIADAPPQHAVSAKATWQPAHVTIEATAPADADVWAAIYEDGTRTSVPRGENAGETLASDRVVRSLVKVAAAGQTHVAEIALDPTWRSAGAVAFAQRADHRIVGATLLHR